MSKSTPPEGVARRKAQTYGVRDPRGSRRAPLGAPHALKQQSGSACYLRCFLRYSPGRAFRPANGRSVSQLLAGPRNGPGRSPGAARVPGSRQAEPASIAPRPASRRLAKRPQRTRWMQCKRIARGGDNGGTRSRHASFRRKPESRTAAKLDTGFHRYDELVLAHVIARAGTSVLRDYPGFHPSPAWGGRPAQPLGGGCDSIRLSASAQLPHPSVALF
jgi:hypothetical protein